MYSSLINNKLLLFLLLINIAIIVAEDQKCESLEHCDKCPDPNKCEKCENGYSLNFEQTKCILVENNDKPSGSGTKSSSAQQNPSSSSGSAKKSSSAPSSGSAKNSSPTPAQNSPPPSGSTKKSSSAPAQNQPSGSAQTSSNNQVNKASNPPVASNKPFSSAFEGKIGEEKNIFSNSLVKMAKYFAICIVVILCLRCIILKVKKNKKEEYFYDDSENPKEKAKTVYIK